VRLRFRFRFTFRTEATEGHGAAVAPRGLARWFSVVPRALRVDPSL
jgi:hypothetical protein